MGFLSKLFQRSAPSPATVADPIIGGFFTSFGAADAGVSVSPELALTASAVWSCVSVISSAISTLEVHVTDSEDGSRNLAHPVAALLKTPNPYMTAATFQETLAVGFALWGNAYAYVDRGPTAEPIGLYPLRAAYTVPRRINGELTYLAMIGGQSFTLRPDQVVHVPAMSFDGISGLSPILYARQSIGLSLALEKFAAKFFGSGGNLGSIIEIPPMKPEAVQAFKAAWTREYTGIENAHRVAVLPDGMKYHSVGTTPEAAQAVEARRFQLLEICRLYRVPPHKVQELERATFSNIEHQAIEFRQDTIQPITTKFEQEFARKLLREDEQASLAVRFNLDALLRSDTESRYRAHNLGIQGGWLTRAEARAAESLPPIVGLDQPLTPLNMSPGNGAVSNGPNPPAAGQRSDQTRRLLESTARRLVTKEGKAVTRAAKKFAAQPVEFEAWAAEFFDEHRDHTFEVLSIFEDLKDLPAFSVEHCRNASREASEAFKSGSINGLVERWERELPGAIANKLQNM